MGEMTDWILGAFVDPYDDYADFCDDEGGFYTTDKVCDLCGKGGLHWESVNGKWYLHNLKGELHVCKIIIERSKGCLD